MSMIILSFLAAIQVFFSPRGGCTAAIVKEVGHARQRVLVQAYAFTSEPIEKALEAAKTRKLNVQVILDRSWQTRALKVEAELTAAGIPVLIDARHAIAHNKVIIIDEKTVITGSFNFTCQADQRNAENLLVIHNARLAAKYAENWQAHAAHSILP